eukprot:SAG22_NODE_3535_length_1656_cov_1.400771_1_plen_139_part_10
MVALGGRLARGWPPPPLGGTGKQGGRMPPGLPLPFSLLPLLLPLLLLLLPAATAPQEQPPPPPAREPVEFEGHNLRLTNHEPPRVAVRDMVALICRVSPGRAARMKVGGDLKDRIVQHEFDGAGRAADPLPPLARFAAR